MKKYFKELEKQGYTKIILTDLYDFLEVYKYKNSYIVVASKNNSTIFKITVEKINIIECLSVFKDIIKEVPYKCISIKELEKEVLNSSFTDLEHKYKKEFRVYKDARLDISVQLYYFNKNGYVLKYSRINNVTSCIQIKEIVFKTKNNKNSIICKYLKNNYKRITIN